MDKQVYKIDSEGYLIESPVKRFDEQGNCTEELPADIITVDPPQGLYRAKWTGKEWIETMTEEEYIATLPKSPEIEPTLEERNRADIDYLSIMTGVSLNV